MRLRIGSDERRQRVLRRGLLLGYTEDEMKPTVAAGDADEARLTTEPLSGMVIDTHGLNSHPGRVDTGVDGQRVSFFELVSADNSKDHAVAVVDFNDTLTAEPYTTLLDSTDATRSSPFPECSMAARGPSRLVHAGGGVRE